MRCDAICSWTRVCCAVTHPTPEMRRAMAEAPVGDDVYGDDPTVLQLQTMAAKMLGKQHVHVHVHVHAEWDMHGCRQACDE